MKKRTREEHRIYMKEWRRNRKTAIGEEGDRDMGRDTRLSHGLPTDQKRDTLRDTQFNETIHLPSDTYDTLGRKTPRQLHSEQMQIYFRILHRRIEEGQQCELCSRRLEVLHHRDGNQCNNHKSNLQNLCFQCHEKTVHKSDHDTGQWLGWKKFSKVPHEFYVEWRLREAEITIAQLRRRIAHYKAQVRFYRKEGYRRVPRKMEVEASQ